MAHPLARLLRSAADGVFPPEDGRAEVVPPCGPGSDEWVVSFTAHAVIATALASAEVHARDPGGLGGALDPRFLLWLAGDGGRVGCQDAVLAGRGRGGGTLPSRGDLDDHPRVRLARRRRTGVAVHGDDRGLVTLGRGLASLPEMSVETATDGGRGGCSTPARSCWPRSRPAMPARSGRSSPPGSSRSAAPWS